MSPTSEILKAKLLHKEGQLNQALRLYSEILNKWPNNIKAKHGILQVYEGSLPSSYYSAQTKIQKGRGSVLKYRRGGGGQIEKKW